MTPDTLLAPRLSAHGIMRRVPNGYEVTRTEDGAPSIRRTFPTRSAALSFLVLGERPRGMGDA